MHVTLIFKFSNILITRVLGTTTINSKKGAPEEEKNFILIQLRQNV
jgi:hypothetical protein